MCCILKSFDVKRNDVDFIFTEFVVAFVIQFVFNCFHSRANNFIPLCIHTTRYGFLFISHVPSSVFTLNVSGLSILFITAESCWFRITMREKISIKFLIHLVGERPALWDKTSDMYKDRSLKETSWREICAFINENYERMPSSVKEEFSKSLKP